MANTIKIKRSSVADAVPAAVDLEIYELAMNIVDGRLFSKNSAGAIIELAPEETPTQVLTKIKTVDGAGSGLDSDLLDGLDSLQFLRSDVADVKTAGHLKFSDNVHASFGDDADFSIYWDGTNYKVKGYADGAPFWIEADNAAGLAKSLFHADPDGAATIYHKGVGHIQTTNTGIFVAGDITATDLHGSADDAKLLDGLDSTQFLRSDQSDTMTGTLTLTGDVDASGDLIFGASNLNLSEAGGGQGRFTSASATYSRISFATDDNAVRGYIGYDSGGYFGINDSNDLAAIAHYTDSHTDFLDAGEKMFSVGVGGITGQYGTVQTKGAGKGGYEGYATTAGAVFMAQSPTMGQYGLFDDNNNQWSLRAVPNGETALRFAGVEKLATTVGGISVTGDVTATNFIGSADDAKLLDGLDSTQFLRSDQSDTMTGDLTVTGTVDANALTFGSTNWTLAQTDTNRSALYGAGNSYNIVELRLDNGTKTGLLWAEGNGNIFGLKSGNEEWMLRGVQDSYVSLYYDNAVKLQTSATGISVTGDVDASGDLKFGTGAWQLGEIDTLDAALRSDSASGVGLALQYNSGVTQGWLYANASGFGLLDGDRNFAIKHVKDSHTDFLDNNEPMFSVGVGGVTGDYGTVQVKGSGKGGWQGYAIDGDAVYMSNGTYQGLYDDTNNQWGFRHYHGAQAELFYNGAKKLETNNGGATVTGNLIVNGPLDLPDNQALRLGDSDDFLAYHSGTAAYFKSQNHGGWTYFQGEDTGGTNRAMLYMDPDGSVTAYYAGAAKFATVATGITVVGEVEGDTLSISGDATIDGELFVGRTVTDIGSLVFSNDAARFSSRGITNHEDPESTVMRLMRDGQPGIIYAGNAQFDLSRWEDSGTASRTQLSIKLSHATPGIADGEPLKLRSDGTAHIGTDLFVTNDATIYGNLTVQGSTTAVNTADLDVEDNNITLNKGETGAGVSAGSAGIIIDRGTLADALILFDETSDKLTFSRDNGTTTYTILTTEDEGAGNGMDADTVDGLDSTQFVRSDVDDTVAGELTFTGARAIKGENSGGNLHIGVTDPAGSVYVNWDESGGGAPKFIVGNGSGGIALYLDYLGNLDITGTFKLGASNLQLFEGGLTDELVYRSGNVNTSTLEFQESDGVDLGYIHGNESSSFFGLLDRDRQWAIKHVHDSHTDFYDNNELMFSVGLGGVTGTYGSVEVKGSGKSSYEGYSINGKAVFMHNGTTTWGLYDDVLNHWAVRVTSGAGTQLYYSTSERLVTTATGISVTGEILADGGSEFTAPSAVLLADDTHDWNDIGPYDALKLTNSSSTTGAFTSLYMYANGASGNSSGRFVLENSTSGSSNFAWLLRDNSHTGFTNEKMRLTSDGDLTVTGDVTGTNFIGSANDAKLLDGLDSTQFLRSDIADWSVGKLTLSAGWTTGATGDLNNVTALSEGSGMMFQTFGGTATNKPYIGNNANGVITMVTHSGPYGKQIAFGDNDDMYIRRFHTSGTMATWRKLYHSGSTDINATTLDGLDSSQFLRSDAADTTTGLLTGSAGIRATGGLTDPRVNFQVWSDGIYGMGMKAGMSYGELNDYAMTFQMAGGTGSRGWWWGTTGHSDAQGSMSLNTEGDLTLAGDLHVNGWTYLNVAGTNVVLESDLVERGVFDFRQNDVGKWLLRIEADADLNWESLGAYNMRIDGDRILTEADLGNLNDADTLDGLDSTQFLRSDATDNFTGAAITMSGNAYHEYGPNTGYGKYLRIGGNGEASGTNRAGIATTNGNLHIDAAEGTFPIYLNFYGGTGGTFFGSGNDTVVAVMGPDGDLWKGAIDNTGSKYWHAGNDGSGSGLDADLLDGLDSTKFLRSDIENVTGLFENITLDNALFSNGDTNTYMQFHAADQWRVVVGGAERLEVNTSGGQLTGTLTVTTALAGGAVDDLTWGHHHIHSTNTDFNTFLNTKKYGAHFVQNTTNGPGHTGATQYYHQRMGLGSDYINYSLQLAFPRNRTDAYIYYRNEENGLASAWYKYKAGDSDLLDGLDSTQFLRSDTDDTYTGSLTGGKLIQGLHPVHANYYGLRNTDRDAVAADNYMIISAGLKTYINGSAVVIRPSNNSTADEFEVDSGTSGLTFRGGQVWHSQNDGAGSGLDADLLDGFNASTASTASTVTIRDTAGDIHARLFRSEYDTTNASINFIMTQVDTASNNYIRPSTPAQFRSSVTDAYYLGASAKAADSELLDGINSSQFLRSDASDSMSGSLTATGDIIAGNGTGGVALTTNDGYGNANLTFNHASGIPDSSGSSARIEVDVDSSSGVSMDFELKSGTTSGVATSLTLVGTWTETALTLKQDLVVEGGDITLSGTGRIQGIDTVSATTDAASKGYVDTAVAGVGYTHPTHAGDDINVDTGALTGATVVSDIDINITTDTLGHVTDANGVVSTRTLTLANLGYTGETNATADQTAAEILTAIKTVDGAGSGLDADLLDGVSSASFLRSDTSDTATGSITFNSTAIHNDFLRMNDGYDIRLGTGNDFRMDHNGTDTLFRSYLHGSVWKLQCEETGGTNRNMIWADPDVGVTLYQGLGSTARLQTNTTGVAVTGALTTTTTATIGTDLTVSGGDITLGGTGRIQGVDTVTADTDAASKGYVDTEVAAVTSNVPSHTKIVSFGSQNGHMGRRSMVLSEDGTLWSWGINDYGQLGTFGYTTAHAARNSPMQVRFQPGEKVVSFSASRYTSAAITEGVGGERYLWTWGYNANGQLGTGNTTSYGKPNYIDTSSWDGDPDEVFVICSYGAATVTFVITTTGKLYGCGYNTNGGLGIGNNTATITTFTQATGLVGSVTAVSGCGYTNYIVVGGTWQAAGYNQYGELGRNNTTQANTFANVQDSTGAAISGITKLECTSSSYITTGYCLTTTNKLYTVGHNGDYQCGTGNTTAQTRAYNVANTVGDFQSTHGRYGSTMYMTTAGALYGFGRNYHGELGRGNTTQVTTPTALTKGGSAITGVDAIYGSGGCSNTPNFWYWRDEDGTDGQLWGAGMNAWRSLGVGWTSGVVNAFSSCYIPAKPLDMRGHYVWTGSNNIDHTVALLADGRLYSCGHSGQGQLGYGYAQGDTGMFNQVGFPA